MDRQECTLAAVVRCIPHTRGDGPQTYYENSGGDKYSPHTWGWTARHATNQSIKLVFPTHVGMDRARFGQRATLFGIPHTRGDGPDEVQDYVPSQAYSPHTWGWTVRRNLSALPNFVFPTHVGMDRADCQPKMTLICIPHTRGDGPVYYTCN